MTRQGNQKIQPKPQRTGSVLLVVIFVIALASAIVIGMVQMNTEEIQLAHNQLYATQARTIAEAGLNDAFSELRNDPDWTVGFTDKAFAGGSYTVVVNGSTITSTGTSPQSFVARVGADVTVGTNAASTDPDKYIVRIDNLRINE